MPLLQVTTTSFRVEQRKNVRVFLFFGKQYVAILTVVRDLLAIRGAHATRMAALTPWRLRMTDVIWIGVPPHLHLWKHVDRIDITQRFRSGGNLNTTVSGNLRIIFLHKTWSIHR